MVCNTENTENLMKNPLSVNSVASVTIFRADREDNKVPILFLSVVFAAFAVRKTAGFG